MNPFRDLSDEKLMQHYLKGESMAFEIIYERHKGKVHGYLNRRLESALDVSEIFQNVFLKFHKSRNLYDEKYPVLQWLYTITRSELLDFFKKKKIDTVPILTEPVSAQSTAVDIDMDNIPNLGENERKVVELRYFSDLDYAEISERLGTSQANTRKILSRGLAKIRRSLTRKDSL